MPDTPHCAEWPRSPYRHHSHCCWGRHTKSSQGGNANTPFALCPQRTSRDSLARTGTHGESDTPHNLHNEQLLLLNGTTI